MDCFKIAWPSSRTGARRRIRRLSRCRSPHSPVSRRWPVSRPVPVSLAVPRGCVVVPKDSKRIVFRSRQDARRRLPGFPPPVRSSDLPVEIGPASIGVPEIGRALASARRLAVGVGVGEERTLGCLSAAAGRRESGLAMECSGVRRRSACRPRWVYRRNGVGVRIGVTGGNDSTRGVASAPEKGSPSPPGSLRSPRVLEGVSARTRDRPVRRSAERQTVPVAARTRLVRGGPRCPRQAGVPCDTGWN